MADLLEQLIEMECADALLDSGVSVPLKRWKLPWMKSTLEVRVTMKRPRLRGQILLACVATCRYRCDGMGAPEPCGVEVSDGAVPDV